MWLPGERASQSRRRLPSAIVTVNPASGSKGRCCEIPEGRPLSSPPVQSLFDQAPSRNPKPITAKSTPWATKSHQKPLPSAGSIQRDGSFGS